MKKIKKFPPLLEGEIEIFPDVALSVPSNPDEESGFKGHIWTENKASLIAKYLKLFVYITHHGTYIDAFAGPQDPNCLHSWAAKLVMEFEPKWMRRFVLFEQHTKKVAQLRALVGAQGPVKPKRHYSVHGGNTNLLLPEYLKNNPIPPKEAAFCLLDQRTFECDWETVKTLASHKQQGNKIELFYFLAQAWLDRSFSGFKKDKDQRMNRWWGDESWKNLKDMRCHERGKMASRRFKSELGYQYAKSFPIFERGKDRGKVMFWMIHASDHPEAIKLMNRAYNNQGPSLSEHEDTDIPFDGSNLGGKLTEFDHLKNWNALRA